MKKILTNILVIISFLGIMHATYVYWEPEIPVPGGNITIYYNSVEGSLPDNATSVYIHLGYNGWQNTDDYLMTYEPALGNGWWSYVYEIPVNAETIDFVFTDLLGHWDNNGGVGIDWHISLNYYWTPFNPTPNDPIEIVLNNVDQGGYIAWSVDAGNGHVTPLQEYWPEGTIVQDDLALTPLTAIGPSMYHVVFPPMASGAQVVQSIKFKILWDDGTWDVGSNGQVMYYDIYLDYSSHEGDPYVFFTSPANGAQISGSTNVMVVGSAASVEFWVAGELLFEGFTSPFTFTWTPDPALFGDVQIVAKATGSDGRVAFLFRDVYVLFAIEHEPVPGWVDDGVNINGNEVILALYAPAKDFVSVKGSWNSVFPDGEMMKLSGDTLWWYQTELPDGEYSYQYNVQNERFMADPWSKDVDWRDPTGSYESGSYEDAQTVFEIGSIPYEWNDQSYLIPAQQDVIVYEMHVGDFKGVNGVIGTYQDIIDKFDEGYFDDLGINAIELMPVNEFEGENSWGYNPTFYMAPESTYGTPDELRQLIDTAHQHGVAVLMDVVFNHMWGSAPLFLLYQPIGSWDYLDHDYQNCPYFHNQESQWGYKLQHWSPRARKHIDDCLQMWVNDYHIDGFRFDHTQGIGWDATGNFGATHYGEMLNAMNPDLIIIAEEDNAYQINHSSFDAGWDYSYYHLMKANLMQINDGGHTYGDMWDVGNHIVAGSQGYWDFTGPLVYIESHDEGRIIYEAVQYQGMTLNTAYLKSKLGATVLLTSQGTPMLYHGQEFGQNGTSHGSSGSLQPQPLQWNNLTTDNGLDLFNDYQKLIQLRKNYAVLKSEIIELKYQSTVNKCIVYWRINGSEEVVVAANFSPNPKTIDIEFPHAGTWYNYMTGDSITIGTNWFGGYEIPPSTALLFLSEIPDFQNQLIPGDVNLDGTVDVLDIVQLVSFIIQSNYPPPGSDQFITSDVTADGAINVQDIVQLVAIILG